MQTPCVPATEAAISRQRHLLFVDDEPRVLSGINRVLHGVDPAWVIHLANGVDEALRCLASQSMDVIVTDVTMPGRDGFDLLRAVSASPQLNHIPVLVLTGLADNQLKSRALNAGAFDLIAKPIQEHDLIARLRSVMRTKDYQDSLADLNATLERKVAERTRELESSRTDILICLAIAGECRDRETGHHLVRVARYARRLAEAAGIAAETVDTIFKTSPLHDIGKLGIPDQILLKPGPLLPQERLIMQTHCEVGHRILTTPAEIAAKFGITAVPGVSNPMLDTAAEIALNHHEKWDGSGYPHRLAGSEIPLTARIVAVADVYDALTSERPYKHALPHDQTITMMLADSGRHFDPALIEALQAVADDFAAIRRQWADPQEAFARSLSSDPVACTPMRQSA